MTRLAYRFTTMRDHTAPMTLIQDILEELRSRRASRPPEAG